MDRYDEHMNKYGHFSEKKKKVFKRSAILDQILASGQKLASNYEQERDEYEKRQKQYKDSLSKP